MAFAKLIRFIILLVIILITSNSYAAFNALQYNHSLIVVYNPPALETNQEITKIVQVDKNTTKELLSLNGSFVCATIQENVLTIYRTKNYSKFDLKNKLSFIKTIDYRPPVKPLLIDSEKIWGLANANIGWFKQEVNLWKGVFFNDANLQTLTHIQLIKDKQNNVLVSGIKDNIFYIYAIVENNIKEIVHIKNIVSAYLLDETTLLYVDSSKELKFSNFNSDGFLLNPQKINNSVGFLTEIYGAGRVDNKIYFLLPNYLGGLDVIRGNKFDDQLELTPIDSSSSLSDIFNKFSSVVGSFGLLLLISMILSPILLRKRLLRSNLLLAQAVGEAIPKRVLALIIDLIITQLLPLIYFFSQNSGGFGVSLNLIELQKTAAFITLFSYMYFFLMERRNGQTIGKIFMGIQVISIYGDKPKDSAILMRNLLRYIDGIPSSLYLLGGFFMSFSSRGQRLGDMLGKTIVVKKGFKLNPEEFNQVF